MLLAASDELSGIESPMLDKIGNSLSGVAG